MWVACFDVDVDAGVMWCLFCVEGEKWKKDKLVVAAVEARARAAAVRSDWRERGRNNDNAGFDWKDTAVKDAGATPMGLQTHQVRCSYTYNGIQQHVVIMSGICLTSVHALCS